jgi:DNA/RNA-binding domain of Phe-tRNA-synthetase-like protein
LPIIEAHILAGFVREWVESERRARSVLSASDPLYQGRVFRGSIMNFQASSRWRSAYPEAMIGILAMGDVANPAQHPGLEARKAELEARLRDRYGSASKSELRSNPVLQAYASYYRAFGKTYHVQLQLESVVYKGKSIPSVAALVEAMFVAELEDMMLTAGHDLDSVQGDMAVDAATGTETYVMMNGQPQSLKQDDMFIGDEAGVLSSIIYGPANRARIVPETQRVIFTVYAPPGIPADGLQTHLGRLVELVQLIAPGSQVERQDVLFAREPG